VLASPQGLARIPRLLESLQAQASAPAGPGQAPVGPGQAPGELSPAEAARLLTTWSAAYARWQGQVQELRAALGEAGVAVRELAAWHLEPAGAGWELVHAKPWLEGLWRCAGTGRGRGSEPQWRRWLRT
jgi:hypothetical protein